MSQQNIYAIAGIIYLLWCGVNYLIAEAKNLNTGTVIVFSICFSPFLGYLYVLGMPKQEKEEEI
ncbi:MAG: hypothetical protein H7Y00_09450 [Fimbriimonadaceae bacterium]|nr:hypothetical protein [Chitinophagales bacterium]